MSSIVPAISLEEKKRLRLLQVDEREHHPLDGVPPPRIVPEFWGPEWVGIRMIEAFEVLARQPLRTPGGGSPWPEYIQDRPSVYEFLERRENWGAKMRPERPTSEEIARCDHSLAWPLRYLGGAAETEMARVIGCWALWRAIGWDVEPAAARRGWRWTTFKRRRATGLLLITVGLIADQIEIA